MTLTLEFLHPPTRMHWRYTSRSDSFSPRRGGVGRGAESGAESASAPTATLPLGGRALRGFAAPLLHHGRML